MLSCGAAAVTARYSSKHTAAGATTTCLHWFIIRSRLFRHLSAVEFFSFIELFYSRDASIIISLYTRTGCCGWLEGSCPYTVSQLGDILSYPSKQMPTKSNSGVLPVWKTVSSLPQFPYCYEIIDEEKPTHAGCSQKQLMLQAAAHAWPFNHT